MITNEMKCPCCGGELIYVIVGTNDEFNKITKTHTWSCEECSIVMFEYYTSENIKGLKKRLKES